MSTLVCQAVAAPVWSNGARTRRIRDADGEYRCTQCDMGFDSMTMARPVNHCCDGIMVDEYNSYDDDLIMHLVDSKTPIKRGSQETEGDGMAAKAIKATGAEPVNCFMVGTIECKINESSIVAKGIMAAIPGQLTQDEVFMRKARLQAAVAKSTIAREEKERQLAFSKLEEKLRARRGKLKDGIVIKTRKGMEWREATPNQQRGKLQSASFDASGRKTLTPHTIYCKTKSSKFSNGGVKCATSKRMRTVRKPQSLKMKTESIDALIEQVMTIAGKHAKQVTLIDKQKANKVWIRRVNGVRLLQIETKHHKGIISQKDASLNNLTKRVARHFAKKTAYVHPSDSITHGHSGVVFLRANISGSKSYSIDDLFVVRGKRNGKLMESRNKVAWRKMFQIDHYSIVGIKIWNAFDAEYVKLRDESVSDHDCVGGITPEECGILAAQILRVFYPCWRITCTKCISNWLSKPTSEQIEHIYERGNLAIQDLNKRIPSAHHVTQMVELLRQRIKNTTFDMGNNTKVHELIGHRQDGVFRHLNRLNNSILAANGSSTIEWESMNESLLELARWHNKRTESIAGGGISSFRNKISAKAQINFALMCDNQLDTNGNFVWGERGYHAKRFFSEFFTKIDPKDGYSHHTVRSTPTGVRHLAIGNLIIPGDLQKLREKLEGVSITTVGISEKCISRRNGDFVYPCSCVTSENGKPVLSDVILPTRNHLVIGNTGDPKLVDLPKTETGGMWIAKEGYCYINIFFAMLVNVSEKDAKDFTKFVRDEIMPQLGKWPTMMDVATACYKLAIIYPDVRDAQLPRILVDHSEQIFHVIDSYGSMTTGYHILKAGTVSQLISFAHGALLGEMKMYRVGGTQKMEINMRCCQRRNILIKQLIRAIYRPKLLMEIIETEPFVLMLAIVSPSILKAMFRSGTFNQAIKFYMHRSKPTAQTLAFLEALSERVSRSRVLSEQFNIIDGALKELKSLANMSMRTQHTYSIVQNQLDIMIERVSADAELLRDGFVVSKGRVQAMIEKNYQDDLRNSFTDLPYVQQLQQTISFSRVKHGFGELCESKDLSFSKEAWMEHLSSFSAGGKQIIRLARTKSQQMLASGGRRVTLAARNITMRMVTATFSEIMKFVNMLLVLSMIFKLWKQANTLLEEREKDKWEKFDRSQNELRRQLRYALWRFEAQEGRQVTREEFLNYLKYNEGIENRHELINELIANQPLFSIQAKKHGEIRFEQTVALMALLAMMFGSDRSDAVFSTLSKVRTIFTTMGQEVRCQSIDDIHDVFDEKKATIDFELATDQPAQVQMDKTFCEWWQNQMEQNRTVPHYRTGGKFIEFTRSNAASVANEIAHTPDFSEYLIRGAVGSGKSTGLPCYLSAKGKVLLLEPTRPLTENVCAQLRGSPFHKSPSMSMRNGHTFGSTPIHVMTTGYALHFFCNNVERIREYDFVIFDECHVIDSSAMSFYCALKEYSYQGKILKVSATPPGREVEFKTQFPVTIATEDSLSFDQFVQAQGSGANCDVLKKGHNILVYVSSYNEVDRLSKLLVDRGFKVTKVDGRTMKLGGVEISTSGTAEKPHFIVATNIIENGVTLDIDVVVDFGVKVVAELDADARTMRYNKQAISYGERIQRLGRVGGLKDGHALRIGHTEKGITEIPVAIAVESAFQCFAYGLPVMTSNVSTSIIGNCTVKQARTMMNFELSPFFTVELVKYNGTMHPEIHKILVPYKLRDSSMQLCKEAIPNSGVSRWHTAHEYISHGIILETLKSDVRIPFYLKGVPEKVYEKIWNAVCVFKSDSGFGRMSTASACNVAYTLKTDPLSITRTIAHIDALLIEEQEKKSQFDLMSSHVTNSSSISLAGLVNRLRSKWMVDHSSENIVKLQNARSQLLEFRGMDINLDDVESFRKFGCAETVRCQSKSEVSKTLQLKGKWNKPLITSDFFVVCMVSIGCIVLMYQIFMAKWNEPVELEGKSKAKTLRFRQARDNNAKYEVFADEDSKRHYFGEAYTKKGKKSGKARGMGVKTKKFVNVYGFDPCEYSLVRFVDPLTGLTYDRHPMEHMMDVQETIGDDRREAMWNDELDKQLFVTRPTIEAYYIKDKTTPALKIDLNPHNPMRVCDKVETIAGFPEREFELRQSGSATLVPYSEVPVQNEKQEFDEEHVRTEAASLHFGLRDYNPIAQAVCRITNTGVDYDRSIFGIGFGQFLITNAHCFKLNEGETRIVSRHGQFTIEKTHSLPIHQVKDKDMVIVRLPKDFPPFPQRLQFRAPQEREKICLVGSNFQEKSIQSVITESCMTFKHNGGKYWKHWITTKEGHCGLPVVALKDGHIVGIHNLGGENTNINYFTPFDADILDKYLLNAEALQWTKGWKYNKNKVCWGGLELLDDNEPEESGLFRMVKLLKSLEEDGVRTQSRDDAWLEKEIKGSLKVVARCPGQLVTKHVVKGPCAMFQLYLELHEDAKSFFTPRMGSYGKSRLSKGAFIKDIMKYSSNTVVGNVDCDVFENAIDNVEKILWKAGMMQCEYVTDAEAIFQSLNMNAAVGAMYQGKKKDYFEDFTAADRELIVKQSCERLFLGKKGVWNGSLKAELRPIEKVHENKTRTFTAAPLDTLLGGKVCVDDFNNFFYSCHLRGPWTVGITKFYAGWNEFLSKLPDGWLYCDADGSRFDSSLTPYLINAVLELRLRFMEEWDAGEQMLKNLYTEIIYTPIATPDGSVIKKTKGNNSGQPSTVVDNTLMVILAMQYSLQLLGVDFETQDEVVRYFANGDDLLIAVRPDCEFVLKGLETHFSNLGLNYDFSARHHDKKDVWFMSTRGILRDGILIPKLEEERIVAILEWDRSREFSHRLDAICAAMIEAWGYDELLQHIRKFYYWLLEQEPYRSIAQEGKAPYIAETALRHLYTNAMATQSELEKYTEAINQHYNDEGGDGSIKVRLQAGDETKDDERRRKEEEDRKKREESIDASQFGSNRDNKKNKNKESDAPNRSIVKSDRDVDAGTSGTIIVPRLEKISAKIRMPKHKGGVAISLQHLVDYNPAQVDISNTRATQSQFDNWWRAVSQEYGVGDNEMQVLASGLMVWCIENGTSPNINGMWTMMDGEEQVEYPLKPVMDNARPTFRQIMAHFSDVAEAYIEKRNSTEVYIPRYALQRNLRDPSLARYGFDFYEITAKTPVRAREAHFQMKAAAIRGKSNSLFGLDGNVGTQEENTERHTAEDVNQNMHNLLGMRAM
uniref:Genome polyprotein n=1 Tax=Pea seed-borne mosaic virus TaxID=12208 RepID=A0A482ARU2_9POTV|nr:polyprotein [Pea seed-borne mosaic virus]